MSLYLIDSGVYGSETKIMDYLDSIGRNTSEIKGVFLTHAHPDHIGSAAWFREHSCDEVSYLVGDCLFIGDAVPVKGDIPIFIDEQEIRKTMNILETLEGIETYYPAWDRTYDREMMKSRLADAVEIIDMLKNTVLELDDGTDLETLTSQVCDRLNMQMLKTNPLFCRTINCLR